MHTEGDLMNANGRRVLIVVQNLPVPMDRRVWMECLALRDAGYKVSVICPKGPFDARDDYDGVHVYRYRDAPAAGGALGYLLEFVYCWLRTAWLSLRVWREQGFDVLQACNPPDTYWLLARLWRPRGVKFVFDHHDLSPELFRSRFGEPQSAASRVQLSGLTWLERRTYATADHVISANDSYRAIAIDRGGCDPGAVTVVRSCPDTRRMRPVVVNKSMKRKAPYILAYLGIMGPQDGIDVLLRSIQALAQERGRTDFHAVLMGFGDSQRPMQQLAGRLGINDFVTFTGRVGPAEIARNLSSATIGLCPDQKNPLNDVSTMNKTMEYMAYALPVVAYDLAETRVSAGDCAVYVPSGDISGFARTVDELLDDPQARREMSKRARVRCASILDWELQACRYVEAFDSLTGASRPRPQDKPALTVSEQRLPDRRVGDGVPPRIDGQQTIDLRDPAAFDAFLNARNGLGTLSSVAPGPGTEAG